MGSLGAPGFPLSLDPVPTLCKLLGCTLELETTQRFPREPVPEALESENATCVSVYQIFISGRAGGRPEPGEAEDCTQDHAAEPPGLLPL